MRYPRDMLQFLGIVEGNVEALTIGEYVPITIDYGEEIAYERCVMWRTGNSRSLVQLWLDKRTGTLTQLEVVCVEAKRARREKEDPIPVAVERGHPAFDVADAFVPDPEWKTYQVMDEERPFDFVLYSSVARLILDPTEPERFVGSERAAFGLDDRGRLCRIDIGSLTPSDMTNLRAYLDHLEESQGSSRAPRNDDGHSDGDDRSANAEPNRPPGESRR